MASTPGFEPGPHWWEASALTIALPFSFFFFSFSFFFFRQTSSPVSSRTLLTRPNTGNINEPTAVKLFHWLFILPARIFCPVGRLVRGAAWVQVRGSSPVYGQIQPTRVSVLESHNNMSTSLAYAYVFFSQYRSCDNTLEKCCFQI